MIASYCPKKDCVVNIMLLTMDLLPEIASNSTEKKPKVILYYNSTVPKVKLTFWIGWFKRTPARG